MFRQFENIQDKHTQIDILRIQRDMIELRQSSHTGWNFGEGMGFVKQLEDETFYLQSGAYYKKLMYLTNSWSEVEEIVEAYKDIVDQCREVGHELDTIISETMGIQFDCGEHLMSFLLDFQHVWTKPLYLSRDFFYACFGTDEQYDDNDEEYDGFQEKAMLELYSQFGVSCKNYGRVYCLECSCVSANPGWHLGDFNQNVIEEHLKTKEHGKNHLWWEMELSEPRTYDNFEDDMI